MSGLAKAREAALLQGPPLVNPSVQLASGFLTPRLSDHPHGVGVGGRGLGVLGHLLQLKQPTAGLGQGTAGTPKFIVDVLVGNLTEVNFPQGHVLLGFLFLPQFLFFSSLRGAVPQRLCRVLGHTSHVPSPVLSLPTLLSTDSYT